MAALAQPSPGADGVHWPFKVGDTPMAMSRCMQVMVVPITSASYDYAQEVRRTLRACGFHADADSSNNKMQKKVRTEFEKQSDDQLQP